MRTDAVRKAQADPATIPSTPEPKAPTGSDQTTRMSLRFWSFWFAALACALCIHLQTLPFSPALQQDEAQIVEFGRAVLQPGTDWSVNLTSTGRPLVPICYVGSLLQELAYRATSSHTGPRMSSLLGAAVAATMIVGWLLARGTEVRFAWLLGAAFFLDPIFTSSFRPGRVDSWALAACIGAAWVLRSRMAREHPLRCCSVAGGLAAAGFLLWPTAGMTYPLLLSELVSASRNRGKSNPADPSLLIRMAIFLGSALLALAVLLVPLLRELKTPIPNLKAMNVSYGKFSLKSNTLAFLRAAALDPFIVLLALLGAARRSGRNLAILALVIIGWTLTMHVYACRLVYLLPYAIVLSGFALARRDVPVPRLRRLSRVLLYLGLVWAAGLSLGVRTYEGFHSFRKHSPLLLEPEAKKWVGDGPYKVYVEPWELYYPGRALRWKMYKTFSGAGPLDDSLLRNVDYAILYDRGSRESRDRRLARMGLTLSDSLPQSGAPQSFLGYNLGFTGYGPYVIYRKAASGLGGGSCPQ
jgi:hypothetical protein